MSTVPYVSQIKGNLKGAPFDIAVGPRTLIVGDNGDGKSRLQNALEFALTKVVSDVAGRETIALPAELLSLGDGAAAWAEVTVTVPGKADTVMLAARTERKPDGGATQVATSWPSPWNSDLVLPLRRVRAALLGSPATARAFFLSCIGVSNRLDPADLPDEELRTRAATLCAGTPLLQDVIEAANKANKADTERINGLAVAVEALAGNNAMPSFAQINDAHIRVAEANAALESIIKAHASTATVIAVSKKPTGVDYPDLPTAQHALADADARLAGLSAMWAEAEARVKADPTLLTPFTSEVQERVNRANYVLRILTHMGNKGMTKCVCCAQTVTNARQVFEAQADMIRTVMGDTIAVEEAKRDFMRTFEQIKGIRPQWVQHKGAIEAWIAWHEANATQGNGRDGAETAHDHAMELQEARANAQAVRDELARLESAASRLADTQTARQDMVDLIDRVRLTKNLVTELHTLGRNLMASALVAFEAKVQTHLSAGVPQFKLVTTGAGGGETFRVALANGHEAPRTALSGAEWARVTMAVTAAVCEADRGKLRVIIPEERAFDPHTLQEVMEVMRNAPGQVFLTSPIMPMEVPDGWTVIHVSARSRVNEQAVAGVAAEKKARKPRKSVKGGLSIPTKALLAHFKGVIGMRARAVHPDESSRLAYEVTTYLAATPSLFPDAAAWDLARTELITGWPDLEAALPTAGPA